MVMKYLIISIAILPVFGLLRAQEPVKGEDPGPDTAVVTSRFDPVSAMSYIDGAVGDSILWRERDHTLRNDLQRLLLHAREPFDTARQRLSVIALDTIPVHKGEEVLDQSIEVRWINDSTFLVDPSGWNTDLYLKQERKLVYPVDLSTLTLSDSLLDENGMLDSAIFTPDTIQVQVIDTAALEQLEIRLYQFTPAGIVPPLSDPAGQRAAILSQDLSRVDYYKPSSTWLAAEDSPFRVLKGERQLDSLQQAMEVLLDFTRQRDSTLLLINDMYGKKTPVWITTGSEEAFRFWVKNYNNDSITLWIGNPARNEISLLLEDDVNFSRLVKEEISHLSRFVEPPKKNLHAITPLEAKPVFWDYSLSSNMSFNQTYLSHWTKGGESSLATMVDMSGKATYNNKDKNMQWLNSARLQFGTIMSEEKGFRKNHDLFEITSKLNRNPSGKIGFSASFYMKNQLAKGYDYPNDSVPISKFLNPGTLTVGIGLEYKPLENTTINVAPLSYKTTFVLDTAHIDQTTHGIHADKRAKQELGTQIVVENKVSPLKEFEITSRLRLFSNYLSHPENIDVDLEMIMEKKINWFFTVRLDLHLIYDDDIMFTVFDDADQPVLLPDGSKKQVPKAQFKEFLGISFQFKF